MKRSKIPYTRVKDSHQMLCCPKCETLSEFKDVVYYRGLEVPPKLEIGVDGELILQDYYYMSRNHTEYRCDNCGESFKRADGIHGVTERRPTGITTLCKIYMKEREDDKIQLELLCVEATPRNTKYGVYELYFRDTIIFNCTTGQSYQLEPHVLGSHARLRGYEGPKIKNISYGSINLWTANHNECEFTEEDIICSMEDLLKSVDAKIHSIHPNLPISNIDVRNMRFTGLHEVLPIILAHNRFPTVSRENLSMIRSGEIPMELVRKIRNTDDFFPKLYEVLDATNEQKSIKKMLVSDMKTISTYQFARKITKDPNIIRNMMLGFYSSSCTESLNNNKETNQFISALKCICGHKDQRDEKLTEVTVSRKLLQKIPTKYKDGDSFSYDYYFQDSARLYNKIIKRGIDIKIQNDSLKEIHDNLSWTYSHIRMENAVFNTPISIITKLEKTIDEYSFVMAKDSNELIRVGNNMDICVGGYDDKVIEDGCKIVLCRKNGKEEACIEIDGHAKGIIQAKLSHNRLPEGEVRDAILKWSKECNLSLSNTHDIRA